MYRDNGTSVPFNFGEAIEEDFYFVAFYALLMALPLNYKCWDWAMDPKYVELKENMVMTEPLISSTRLMTVSELCRGIIINPSYERNYYEKGYHLLYKDKQDLYTGSEYDESSFSTHESSRKGQHLVA